MTVPHGSVAKPFGQVRLVRDTNKPELIHVHVPDISAETIEAVNGYRQWLSRHYPFMCVETHYPEPSDT